MQAVNERNRRPNPFLITDYTHVRIKLRYKKEKKETVLIKGTKISLEADCLFCSSNARGERTEEDYPDEVALGRSTQRRDMCWTLV